MNYAYVKYLSFFVLFHFLLEPISANPSFPFQAQLSVRHQDKSRTTCDGTLIHRNWMLTSAECLLRLESPVSISIQFSDDQVATAHWFRGAVFIEPGQNRFALIWISRYITLTPDSVYPIELPSLDDCQTKSESGTATGLIKNHRQLKSVKVLAKRCSNSYLCSNFGDLCPFAWGGAFVCNDKLSGIITKCTSGLTPMIDVCDSLAWIRKYVPIFKTEQKAITALQVRHSICGPVPYIAGGTFGSVFSTFLGDAMLLHCGDGFKVEGPLAIICRDSKWTEAGNCVRENTDRKCVVPNVGNGFVHLLTGLKRRRVVTKLVNFGSTKKTSTMVMVTCDEDAQLHGAFLSVCDQGMWIPPVGHCYLNLHYQN